MTTNYSNIFLDKVKIFNIKIYQTFKSINQKTLTQVISVKASRTSPNCPLM